MAKEEKDLNKGQVVTDPDLTAQAVDEQGVADPAGVQRDGTVLADGTSQDKDVPYSKFKEANEAKKAAEEAQRIAEEQLQQTRDQIALVNAQPIQAQVEKPVSNYEQALRDCGVAGEDYLTEEQRIKVNARQEQINAVKTQQDNQVFANQQFAQSHSDFGTAVGQANPVTGQFMYSAELQKILTEKPHLQGSCYTAQGAYKVVMEQRKLAKLSEEAAAMKEHQQQQGVDANLSPMSSAAAGGGAVSRNKSQITETSTADDVRAIEQRVKAGEFG